MKKLVGIILCEESQEICKAFRELGVECYSCDLQDCSGGHPEWHIKGDALKEAYSGKYDFAICHPPCDFLSNAGARWLFGGGVLNQDRYQKGLLAKEFFMKLYDAPIKYMRIENPLPSKIYNLPKHSQIVQPYQHGHSFSKRTLLWNINLPNIIPTNVISDYVPYLPSNTGGAKRGQKATPKNISKIDSSKTFSGIAKAIAKQTFDFINNTLNCSSN